MLRRLQVMCSAVSFLLAFKSVLIEGDEIAILSLTTVELIGKRNVILGLVLGLAGTLFSYLIVSQVFAVVAHQTTFLGLRNGGEIVIDLFAGGITIFFSWRFLKEFVKYRRTHSSFGEAMTGERDQIISHEREALARENLAGSGAVIPVSVWLALPVFSITLSEGFEASLVISAATVYNQTFAVLGAASSIVLVLIIAAVAYRRLTRVPKWSLEALAGSILLVFGSYFVLSALLLYP